MKRKTCKQSLYTFADLTWGQEEIRMENNMAEIDERLEKLSEYLDKDLTYYEKTAVLEIVDEYTPKNGQGNYLVDLLPFEYAWKIYEAKKEEIERKLLSSIF